MLHILAVIMLSTGDTADLSCLLIPGNLTQIDAGAGQVYGVNDNDSVYQWLNNENNEWGQIPGNLIHVTVGPAGVWGVNRNNNILKFQNCNWLTVPGGLKQVDAGGNKFIAGVNSVLSIFCMNQTQMISTSTTVQLNQIPGLLNYYTCGLLGCWGVNNVYAIFYRNSVTPVACQGSQWQQISGGLKMVEVGTDGSVFGINPSGNAFYRGGITAINPAGTVWTQLVTPGPLKHLSYDGGYLWVITKEGEIYKCEVDASVIPAI